MSYQTRYGVQLIAAVGRGGEIGYRGGLPWGVLENDLSYFRRMTVGDVVICGRKTFDGLPKLPKRAVVCWSKKGARVVDYMAHPVEHHYTSNGPLETPEDLMRWLLELYPTKSFWVIGGAQVYREFIAAGLVYRSHINHIDWTGPADTYFPFTAMQGGYSGTKADQEGHDPQKGRGNNSITFVVHDQEAVDPEAQRILENLYRPGALAKASALRELGRYVSRWFEQRR